MLSPEQLELRRLGIGGSEISAILPDPDTGRPMHPFTGPLDVYLSKVEGWDAAVNEDMERGAFLEAGIAEWYAKRHETNGGEVGTVVHPTRPVCRATPDRVVNHADGERLVSIKCPRRAGDRWGETGGSIFPDYCELQLQWEDAAMTAYGFKLLPVFHLVALVDGELRVYPVQRDVELQEKLITHAEAWWAKHVVAKVPPPLDGSETGTAWLRQRFPTHRSNIRQADITESLAAMALREGEAALDNADRRYEQLRQVVEQHIGDAEGLEGSFGRITFRANKNGVRSFKPTWRNT